MGERCLIVTKNLDYGVYLHHDGEPHNVIAGLRFCELAGYRTPESDPAYGFARLVQTFANFNPDGLGVGITKSMGSPGDSGVYVIENWRIIGWYQEETEPGKHMMYDSRDDYMLDQYNVNDILRNIYNAQPKEVQRLISGPLEVPCDYIEDMWCMEILPQRLTKTGKWVKDEMHPAKRFK